MKEGTKKLKTKMLIFTAFMALAVPVARRKINDHEEDNLIKL